MASRQRHVHHPCRRPTVWIDLGRVRERSSPVAGTKLYFDCATTTRPSPSSSRMPLTSTSRGEGDSRATCRCPRRRGCTSGSQPGTALSTNDFEMNNLTVGAPCAATTTSANGGGSTSTMARGAQVPVPSRICNTTVLPMSGQADGCVPTTTPTYTDHAMRPEGPGCWLLADHRDRYRRPRLDRPQQGCRPGERCRPRRPRGRGGVGRDLRAPTSSVAVAPCTRRGCSCFRMHS